MADEVERSRIALSACFGVFVLAFAGCDLAQPCGGGPPCPATTFCKTDQGMCGNNTGVGVCTPMPELCTQEFAPVCGCDGQTYSNACMADAAGVSVDHVGECATVCGGIAGLPCGTGEFCQLNIGECCCDFQGVCAPIPDVCIDLFAPVCACDGQTYSNGCVAAMAGVSIDHDGACVP